MKKLFVSIFLTVFCFLSIYGETDKKDPLIVINGKISNIKLNPLDPNNIESLSVTKSPSFKEEYGILAENGVIFIITKDYVRADNQKDQPLKPLVLVDGEVYTCSLDSINVREIESIDVLNVTSALKLYGKAGENGVILVKIKEKPRT